MVFNALEQTLLIINPPIVVGLSGGPDSMTLLHAMMANNLSPIAAHFNHKLRDDADQEAAFVREFCLSAGLPFREGAGDVRQFSNEQGLSLEEAARILRYQFLFKVAETEMAGAVAVAHHADDQVETILMNLLRGSGMKGLSGMQVVSLPNPWSDRIPLVRPFLDLEREQILEYLTEQQIPSLEDPTNKELVFQRNKIRLTLIPQLEKLTPGFNRRLLQTAQIISAEDQALEYFSEIAWKSCLHSQGASYLQLARDVLLNYPPAVQRRLIRKSLACLRPEFRELSFLQVDAALDFFRNPAQKSTNWVAKVNLSQSPKWIVLSTWETDIVKDQFPQMLNKKEIALPLAGEVFLGNGWYLVVTPRDYTLDQYELAEFPGEDFLVWVDQKAISKDAVLRVRQEGDLIYPLGMSGKSMKVADMMINEKVPALYRNDWPLVAVNDTVLWVPGGRLSQDAMITPETESLVELAFIRKRS